MFSCLFYFFKRSIASGCGGCEPSAGGAGNLWSKPVSFELFI